MHQVATPSRLIVLLVTDIVGSTELKARIGLSAYARLLAQHDDLFKRSIATVPQSEILKDTGDGYFASFPTTSDAVRFALRLQGDLHAREWYPEPLKVRIGIHVGEVAQIEKEATGKPKIVGMAADVASRVAKLATGGQILLTRFAFNEARQFVTVPEGQSLKWVAHGEYRLRGADEAIEVYEVGIDGLAPLSAPPASADARRAVALDDEETLGWRPAVGLPVPDRPHWVLDRRLGAGGFGEVWLGHHHKLGLRRVFKFCFDADRLRSFKREITLFRLLRDALGEREDIARLHEVKIDAAPYFIESDYTQGGDLHEWSAQRGGLDAISLATRLDIVARIADAVAAAHSVGVLHKDLKPSNILIEEETGQPRPRLADFGIGIITDRSKLRERAITETGFTQYTLEAQSTATGGTRLYAPPEVLVGRPFTVQGDIYALGVILYQMIVGDLSRPLAEGWQRDVADELLREDVAACVEGDPARRLSSASDLAKRLRALPHRRTWQQQERERARAAGRKRRAAQVATGAAMVLLFLLAVAAAFAWRERGLRREAEAARAAADAARIAEARQRTVARGVADFLHRTLTSVDPDASGKDVTVVQAINAAEQRLRRTQKTDPPEVVASALKTLGDSLRVLGETARAEPLLRESLSICVEAKGPDDPDTHAVRAELATCLADAGKLDEAIPHFRQALDGLARTRGPEDPLLLNRTIDLSLALLRQNKNDEAERLARRVYETQLRLHGPDAEETVTAVETLAGAAMQRGDVNASADLFRQVYESRLRNLGEDDSLTRLAAHNFGTLLYRTGHAKEAEPIFTRVVELQKKTLGESHPRTLAATETLATIRDSLGRKAEAMQIEEEVVNLRRRAQGPEHPDTLASMKNLAAYMSDTGRGPEADTMLRSVLATQQRLFGDEHPDTLDTMNTLATSMVWQDRWDEAEPLHRQVIEIAERSLGRAHPNTITYRLNYAGGLQKTKRYAEAEVQYLIIWDLVQDPKIPRATRRQVALRIWKLYEAMGEPAKSSHFRNLADVATQPAPATSPTTSPTTLPNTAGRF